jgi:hypothetical protein
MLCGLLLLTTGCTNPNSQSLASLSITATPSTVAVGGAVVLKATAHLSDGTTQDVTTGTLWTLSNSALATVSNGALTAKAVGNLTIQAAYVEQTPAGTSPSSANVSPQNLSASTNVTITQPTGAQTPNVPVISWTAPGAITYGTALSGTQLSATANVPGTFVYTPAAGAVLTAGQQTLSVLFTPTDTQTYSSATATVTMTVNQAAPTTSWATPAAITQGTALGATQLDAKASVPGAFAYTPAAGTVPAAGTLQLSAVFTPTDATDYSSATAKTSLVVNAPSNPTPPTPPTPPSNPNPPTVGCGGPTVNLSSGASQSAIQSAISNAPSCAVITFAAGTYGPITSTILLPCGISLTGPTVPYSQTPNQTATLTGSSSFIGWAFQTTSGCSQAQTIQYLAWDGKQPGGNGGGGFLEINGGTTNLTVQNNWLHGVNAPSTDGGAAYQNIQANLINFAGGPTGGVTSKVNILYNIFGSTSNSDCAGAITETDTEDGGGYCNGVGIGANVVNVAIQYNIFHWLEQGMKFYEGRGECNPLIVSNNDYSHIQRIMYETQCWNLTAPMNMNIQYNSFHDRGEPGIQGQQNYDLSVANGCTSPTLNNPTNCVSHIDYNVDVAANSSNQADVGVEVWGGAGTTGNYNYLQGYLWNGITWSASGQFVFNNNNFNLVNNGTDTNCDTGNSGFWNRENNGETATPSCSGNTFSNNISGTTPSAAPTISPAGGTFSGSQVVTITNTGTNRDTNTTDWCTTDGSTPTPGSGTAVGYYNGGTITVTASTTVKCVGMWGALNQPYSYPSGFGYVPSSVVSSSYAPALAPTPARKTTTAAAASSVIEQPAPAATSPVATSPVAVNVLSVTVAPAQPVVSIGGISQLVATANFSDGSVKDVTSQVAWQTSDPRTITVSAAGVLSGIATGPAVIYGSYQGLQVKTSASSSIGEVNWSKPIVITEAGTYSGNWRSTDAGTPAVTVATTAPVVIENSHISSAGSLIKSTVAGSNLTVRNSLGVAENARLKGQANGVFLEVDSPARLDVESNYIEDARSGVVVHGYSGSRAGEQNIVIRSNRARNLMGLLSDGRGGYLPEDGATRTDAQFIQLDSVQAVPGIDVGWNEVINYPGHSVARNGIDIYRSGGTPNGPIEIHDTYIQGAFPYSPAANTHAGSGIVTEGRPSDSAQEVPAFNNIHDNQVVGTTNGGIEFAAGHDNVATNNRVLASGLLADGTRIPMQNAGLVNAIAPSASNYNNTMHDNLVGWACWTASCASHGYRRDQYLPASPADYSTNTVPSGNITLELENNEYQVWMNKVASSGVAVGPSF